LVPELDDAPLPLPFMEDSLPWLPRDPNPAALEPGPASFKTIDGKSTCDDAFETEPPLCKRVGDPHWSFRSSWRSLASPVIESLLLPCSCGSDGALPYPPGVTTWGGAAATAAAAARTAASAAACGTALHVSTKCAATVGWSPQCRRA
jgi:hypothetical protein